MERRLSAIFAADMVGYSRLMEADEIGTIERQKNHRSELIDPKFNEHHGRIVKEMGDGVLVEFSSVVEAVQCAVSIQREMATREVGVGDDLRIQFRIGINLGDIILEDGDIFGDGVNIAARLEQLAEPDGICISGTAFDQLKSNIDVGYEALGDVQVKNIKRPIRAYRVLINSEKFGLIEKPQKNSLTTPYRIAAIVSVVVLFVLGGAIWWWNGLLDNELLARKNRVQSQSDQASNKLDNTLPQVADRPSIAVLPFDNLGQDPDQEIFSDGMTEDLITDLSQVSGLFVIARNTMFTFKGQAQDIQKIGNRLGVNYILEGSVRRSGDNVRINAQLIDVKTGGHIWAQRFDRKLADVFELQDEVVQKIVAALAITLNPVEKERLARVKKVHPDAYIAFLRGLELMRQYSPETNIEAAQFFEKSIEIDPKFTRPYASLAFLLAVNADSHLNDDYAKSLKRAFDYAQQALKLDDGVHQIYFALTGIYRSLNRLDDSIKAAKKAIALDPNYADGYANFAVSLNYDGQHKKALQYINYAMRLNPETLASYRWIKGHTYYLLGQQDKAIQLLESVRDGNPDLAQSYQSLIATYIELGQIDDAEWAAVELLTLIPNFSLSREREIAIYRDEKIRKRYIDALGEAGLE